MGRMTTVFVEITLQSQAEDVVAAFGRVVAGVPEEVRDLVLRAAGRRQYTVTVNDYGSGSFALYAA
jgi:hypothetical protein